MIYTVFVEHASSIRSFTAIATTNKAKAQAKFDEMCQYFFDLVQHEGNASSHHRACDGCITFVDYVVIKSDKSKHIIHFDKFEDN